MSMRLRVGVIGLMGIVGCGGGDAFDIATTPLSGKVGGQAWTVATTETNAFLSASSDTFFAQAYPETFAACSGADSGMTGNRVILNVPKVMGSFSLSFGFTQTFFIQTSHLNFAATRGRMVVDEITPTMIRGGTHFEVDPDNFVNGQFQIPICP